MFLSLVYGVAGHSIIVVRVIQAVLASIVCVLVYRLGIAVFDKNGSSGGDHNDILRTIGFL